MRREFTELGDGRRLSSLVWGDGDPELVFLHGGAQNAHTWDTVALALDRPLVAVDLPGHGHSDGGRHGSLDPRENADGCGDGHPRPGAERRRRDRHVARWHHHARPRRRRPRARPVDRARRHHAGRQRPRSRGRSRRSSKGPDSFASFDDILARTIEHNPTRTVSSLRRGILHNAVQRDDGSWVWRYARHRGLERPDRSGGPPDYSATLGRRVEGAGAAAARPRDAAAVGGRRRRRGRAAPPLPDGPVERIDDAGHSVQGDTPVELAQLIHDFTARQEP